MSKKSAGQKNRPKNAYSVYEQMDEPSLRKLWQSWDEFGLLKDHKKPSLNTIEWWCETYHWVERRKAFWHKVHDEEQRKKLEAVIMKDEEILAITRAVIIKYGIQLRENAEGKLAFADIEKAVKLQRLIIGQPTEIGKHEVEIKDEYEGVSDEELLAKLDYFSKIYKEKSKKKNET